MEEWATYDRLLYCLEEVYDMVEDFGFTEEWGADALLILAVLELLAVAMKRRKGGDKS